MNVDKPMHSMATLFWMRDKGKANPFGGKSVIKKKEEQTCKYGVENCVRLEPSGRPKG